MTAQGDRYHMEGGLVYVGEGTDQMIIPQMGAPHPDGHWQGGLLRGGGSSQEIAKRGIGLLVCGAGVPLDHTRPWCELCKIPFDEKDEIVRCASAIPFPVFTSPLVCDAQPLTNSPRQFGWFLVPQVHV